VPVRLLTRKGGPQLRSQRGLRAHATN
jgi:hypothetical protein